MYHPDLGVAAAGAHGFLRTLLDLDQLPECHRPQATRIVAELYETVWPASDACPLGVTGKPVPAIDAGRDKGGEE